MVNIEALRHDMFSDAVEIFKASSRATLQVDKSLWDNFTTSSVRGEVVRLSQIQFNL